MKQGGFVLLMVMILLLTSALLVLSLMKSVFVYSKIARQFILSHHVFYTLETLAAKLDVNQIACCANQTSPNRLIDYLKKGQGCEYRIKQERYRYTIADLGLFPCLPIVKGDIQYSSHQFYITLIDLQSPYRIVQLRLAKLSDSVAVCALPVNHPINEGISTWRWLG